MYIVCMSYKWIYVSRMLSLLALLLAKQVTWLRKGHEKDENFSISHTQSRVKVHGHITYLF